MNLSSQMNPNDLTNYLLACGILKEHPGRASISVPGAGNMNIVLRYSYVKQSLICKQSVPYVQKYPSIPAPLERLESEVLYYQSTAKDPNLASKSPHIIYFDRAHHLLIMEDLGYVDDMTTRYQQENTLGDRTLIELIHYLRDLHALTLDRSSDYPTNKALRKLNHQHIFVLPFDDQNGFDLDSIQPGLSDVAKQYVENASLSKLAISLGDKYLSEGTRLIHGDFYPGSWMQSDQGLYVIDPEFSFLGHAEFDLGVFVAHSLISGVSLDHLVALFQTNYPYYNNMDEGLLFQWAGIEVMRRIIGLAQLPLDHSIDQKEALLKQAYQLLKI